ncbi:NAD(P)H-dependent FMN reductase [Andreprevotia lacus DSM 23236]|jgi:chromate reductase|uniref:NAD(P)H-dependent FMN reductase n=1 Tax=Andreprevotia lacus DSM 23236 TaxID=1121001 RepID=A0A1W1X6T8_9NEIS|nr:NAD(P)H-dependent oxidoreductase [Andreprevotia lacus]SMC19570.1 NAD(P)H-dependent FMN reductase [Andreprevotia lacus DSM 23236]
MSTRVLAIVGGISSNSINQSVFRALQKLAPAGYELSQFDISTLPFFSQDLENDPPAVVKLLREQVAAADAILFITPEYNRSIPGVLKNAIDWASRPYGQSKWDCKTAAVLGASIGNIGTFGAQHHLRQVLAYLNLRVLGQPEAYLNVSQSLENGEITAQPTLDYLASYWKAFTAWIEHNRS